METSVNNEFIPEQDEPIKDAGMDLLGRDKFAKKLAQFIIGYARTMDKKLSNNTFKSEGLVIGVEGEWGYGKTSVLNMIDEELKKTGNHQLGDNPNIKITTEVMNAWLTTDKMGLTTEFFNIINDAVEKNNWINLKEIPKYVAIILLQIVSIFALSIENNIPILGKLITNITLEKITQKLQHFFEEGPISRQKEKIYDRILQDGKSQWLVIFIDDIDRLESQEIGLLFQLVKNIADFPQIIYVLAYDRSIVSAALDKYHDGPKGAYIEKIVQAVYRVPTPENYQLEHFLDSQLAKITQEHRDSYRFDDLHYRALLHEVSVNYLHTIRNCNRIYNAFMMKYLLCGEECDIGDLLGVTILELYEPYVFYHLQENKELLLGLSDKVQTENEKNKEKEDVEKLISEKECNNPRGCSILLLLMFPHLKKIFTNTEDNTAKVMASIIDDLANEDLTKDINLKDKISYKSDFSPFSNCFDRYFELKLKSNEVPFSDIKNFMNLKSNDKVYSRMLGWLNNKEDSSQLEYVLSHMHNILSDCLEREGIYQICKEQLEAFLLAFNKLLINNSRKQLSNITSNKMFLVINDLFKLAINENLLDYQFWERIFKSESISLSFLAYVLFQKGGQILDQLKSKGLQETEIENLKKLFCRGARMRKILAF